jgi:hypothetical protein
MRLRIWIEDEQLSPDTETTTYLDVDMLGEWSLPELRTLVVSFVQQANSWLAKTGGGANAG